MIFEKTSINIESKNLHDINFTYRYYMDNRGYPQQIAPHRGFSNKARCVLLDSPKIIYRFPRTGSDEEFLRKISAIRAKYKYRSDSARDSAREDPSNQSSPSVNISKTYGSDSNQLDFDDFDESRGNDSEKKPLIPGKIMLKHRMLAEIGKTRSAGEIFQRSNKDDFGDIMELLCDDFDHKTNIQDSSYEKAQECNETNSQKNSRIALYEVK